MHNAATKHKRSQLNTMAELGVRMTQDGVGTMSGNCWPLNPLLQTNLFLHNEHRGTTFTVLHLSIFFTTVLFT